MENPVKTLLTGNWIMALCGCFYLAWWIVTFRPPKPRNSMAGSVLLALAFLAGMAGLYLMGRALNTEIPAPRPGVRNLWIVIAGVIIYAALLSGTRLIFHRQVTSELLIITAWTVLEFCAVNFLYRTDSVSDMAGILLTGIILASMIGSLICYILYYRLPYTAGFIDGCIPLILSVGAVALVNLAARGE